MNHRVVITLLFFAVLASGCADSSSTQGISVTELKAEPSNIFAGSSTSVSMSVRNTGLLEGNIVSGEEGSKVLTNHCTDIFDITEYRASSSKEASTEENYTLSQGEQARFYWRLKQANTDEVPLNGFRCDLKFEIPFNYSVSAYKQLQFKESREVEGSSNLETKVSEGPLRVVMDVIGSTSQQPSTILTQDDASIYITIENTDNKDSPYQGLIEINDIEITSTDKINLQEDCGSKESITLSTGNQEIYKCNIEPSNMDAPSIRGEISAQVDYTFVKDVGSRRVEVKYREN